MQPLFALSAGKALLKKSIPKPLSVTETMISLDVLISLGVFCAEMMTSPPSLVNLTALEIRFLNKVLNIATPTDSQLSGQTGNRHVFQQLWQMKKYIQCVCQIQQKVVFL